MKKIDELIIKELEEDKAYFDITTMLCVDNKAIGNAYLLLKEDGVLAGGFVFKRVFEILDPSLDVEIKFEEGEFFKKGAILGHIRGRLSSILSGERTALNFLQHLSGIATITYKFKKLIEGTSAVIADTRKTLPGLRELQKYAVRVAGGVNHRYDLSTLILIKDNHIKSAGSIKKAVERAKEKAPFSLKIEVEVKNLDEFNEALKLEPDIIMLDNMSIDDMKAARETLNSKHNKKILLEASGGINESTIKNIAESGVDIISVGGLTHSVKALDISLEVE